MEIDSDLLSRNVITSASADGLVVTVNGPEEFRSWDRVIAASVGTAKYNEADIFVLAIVFDDTRSFVLGEVEAAWSQVMEHLHAGLPGVEPFTSWGPKLLAHRGVLDLFERKG